MTVEELLEKLTETFQKNIKEHRVTRRWCVVLAVICTGAVVINIGRPVPPPSLEQRQILEQRQQVKAMAKIWYLILDAEGNPDDDIIKQIRHIYEHEIKERKNALPRK